MGKTLCVKRMTERLQDRIKEQVNYPLCVTIPIHGPDVDCSIVMRDLRHHLNKIDPVNPPPQIFHFDIAHSVRYCCI